MEIFLPIVSITALFFVLMLFRTKICVICSAVSLTWITLLILYKLNYFNNQLLIGLLMGQSVVGIFYLVDSKVPDKMKVFRLPFLLTMTLIAFTLIVIPVDLLQSVFLLGILWLLFSLVYFYRNNENTKKLVQRLIDCCKNW